MTGGDATGRFHSSPESSLALNTQGPWAARLDYELPSTHTHIRMGLPAWPVLTLRCSGFQQTLPLCVRHCLWHLLCGSSSYQIVPQWFPPDDSCASSTLIKKHFLPAEFQFRRISGSLLLLASELSCHPLLGFSALPSPIPTVTCIIFHRFRHSAWFLFSWLCFYSTLLQPLRNWGSSTLWMAPMHRRRKMEDSSAKISPTEYQRLCFCSWHVDNLLVYLVSKLALPSNSFVACGSPVFQVDLCSLSKLEMLLSHGSLATVMTLCY